VSVSIVHASVTHEMNLAASWRDEFGLQWCRVECPICGRVVQLGPSRIITLNPGTMAMTAEDAQRVIALHDEGRHAEANRLTSLFPGHKYASPGFDIWMAEPDV